MKYALCLLVLALLEHGVFGDEIPPPLKAEVRTVPLLSGSENVLADVELRLEKKRVLKRVLADSDVLEGIRITDLEGKPVTEMGRGSHRLQIRANVPAGFDLSGRIDLNFQGLEFGDGTILGGISHSYFPAYPIHRQGEADCHTTRIPALARTNEGTLLAVYDLRYDSPKDLQGHMDIGLSRSTDGGQTWERPKPIMDMGEFGGKGEALNGCSDPNILVDSKTGKIFVSAVWTHGKPGTHQWRGKGSEPGFEIHKSSQFMMVTSEDDGKTWSAPENWTERLKDEEWWLFVPAPGNGITLEDGTLVMPTQGRDAKGLPFSNLMWSRDHGTSWTVGAAARSDTTESSVAQLSDGSLLLNMRDNLNRKDKSKSNGRALSVTEDLGETWKIHPADHSALQEPTCMASMIHHTLEDGRHLLLFSNPDDKHSRHRITIKVSLDDGRSWPPEHRLLLDQGAGRGYSSLVMVDDDTVGILYESSVANLAFQQIKLVELGLGD